MHELHGAVLRVGAGLTEHDRASVVLHAAPAKVTCLPSLAGAPAAAAAGRRRPARRSGRTRPRESLSGSYPPFTPLRASPHARSCGRSKSLRSRSRRPAAADRRLTRSSR
jgi:hypothetical protein